MILVAQDILVRVRIEISQGYPLHDFTAVNYNCFTQLDRHLIRCTWRQLMTISIEVAFQRQARGQKNRGQRERRAERTERRLYRIRRKTFGERGQNSKYIGVPYRQQDLPGGSDGKASAYKVGDLGSIPTSGRSSGEGNGNPLFLAWKIPWTVEPDRLQSMEQQRVGHN